MTNYEKKEANYFSYLLKDLDEIREKRKG